MHRDVPASLMVCANANALTAKSDALIVLRAKNQGKRRPTAVYPWVPHDAMIEFGAQIDCVHKFIYGHNNSTSYNQGETRAISPSQR